MKTPKEKKTRIVIVVDGGNVQDAYSTDPELEIELVDFDNLEADGKTRDERDLMSGNATAGLHGIVVKNPVTYEA
jgi:hypothetical protein